MFFILALVVALGYGVLGFTSTASSTVSSSKLLLLPG